MRLNDMPYHDNWKDGKPIQENQKSVVSSSKDTPDPLTRLGAHVVEETLWRVA